MSLIFQLCLLAISLADSMLLWFQNQRQVEFEHRIFTRVVSNSKRDGDLVEVISISDRDGSGLHTWLEEVLKIGDLNWRANITGFGSDI